MSLISAAFLVLTAPQVSINSCTQNDLRDVSFTAVVGKAVQSELRKINDDFAQTYRFDSTDVKMKEPFKLHLTSTVGESDILFILNGSRRLVKIPRIGINKKEDLSKSPGKRQTFFDFGILTPSLFDNYFQAKFVREDRRSGEPVFDVTYVSRLKDGTRHRIWVDKAKGLVTKREWYSQIDRRLVATFYYTDPVKVNGIWVPTELSVKNSDDKLAGTTHYKNVKANTGIADSIFSF